MKKVGRPESNYIPVQNLTNKEKEILENIRLLSKKMKKKKILFVGHNEKDKETYDILSEIQMKGFIKISAGDLETINDRVTGVKVELL